MEDRLRRRTARARRLVAENSLGGGSEALEPYLAALEADPAAARALADEFRTLLLHLNAVLADSGRADVVFDNFARASRLYPNDAHLLNDIGKYLYRYGSYEEAAAHFERALNAAPGHVDAEKNLNSIKNLLVERWHYRMLNDSVRNERYRAAARALCRGASVLDVGTGTGLLALYAREAGAARVLACDGSRLMARVARRVLRRNRARAVRVVRRMSERLTARDAGGRSDLLLTETFDAGLFGERVLQTLEHAWRALLAPGAAVLPAAAEFFVAGVHSDRLDRDYRLCSAAKDILRVPALDVRVETGDETYDCEDVHSIPDVAYLTEPRSVVEVNFNDPKDVRENLERADPHRVELKVEREGVVNVVVGWFRLYLSDGISITTDPRAADRATAWQQAVFFDHSPKHVTENETIRLDFLMNGGKLTMVSADDGDVVRVSSEMIKFLNDTEYTKTITGCASAVRARLELVADASEIRVADLCPFPVFGLTMLKSGARSLTCRATNENDRRFIVRVCEENGVPSCKLTFTRGDEGPTDALGEEEYHAVFGHAVEACGDVEARRAARGAALRRALAAGGVFLPARLLLVAQLVSSRWLDTNNRLYDDNIGDYGIAAHLDRYSVTQNFSIDFSVLKFVPISNPVVVCPYPEGSPYEEVRVPVVGDGYANAILCWYDVRLLDDSEQISTNRPKSFIDGMLFLTYSKRPLVAGTFAKIIQHKDRDGCFKLVMEYNMDV